MRSNPVIWFEIHVQDMARARRFYEGVLGVTLERIGGPDMEMWAFGMGQGKEGAGGALVRMEGVPSGGNSTLVYFACEDCAVEAARVTACGGQLHKPKMSIGQHGHIALALDTEGNMFGLHSMR